MVVEVLTADTGASVGVGIVAPAEDAGVRDVLRQEITEPVDAILRCPGLVAVAVEAVYGDDAERGRDVSWGVAGRDTRRMTRGPVEERVKEQRPTQQ